jgi:hypothetical protein
MAPRLMSAVCSDARERSWPFEGQGRERFGLIVVHSSGIKQAPHSPSPKQAGFGAASGLRWDLSGYSCGAITEGERHGCTPRTPSSPFCRRRRHGLHILFLSLGAHLHCELIGWSSGGHDLLFLFCHRCQQVPGTFKVPGTLHLSPGTFLPPQSSGARKLRGCRGRPTSFYGSRVSNPQPSDPQSRRQIYRRLGDVEPLDLTLARQHLTIKAS